jgi:NhaP-type Na+/H+ or K+/H+ antiporter
VELVNEHQLWATIAFTILLSTVVHGLTAGMAVERVESDQQGGSAAPAAQANISP